MKALVLTAYKEFQLQDMPEPVVGPRDVLIRVEACGICGSDVHGMDGSTGRRRPPIVMGHEASGKIEKIGPEVKDYQIGDRVTFDSTIYNPESYFSKRGLINLCDDRRVLGVSCEDYRQHGAFAELVAVPNHILYALPPGMTYEQAALVEPVSIAVHARNLTPIEPGDTALVFGAGLIGLMTVQVLKNTAVKQIIAVDIDEGKLKVAREVGAHHVLNSGPDRRGGGHQGPDRRPRRRRRLRGGGHRGHRALGHRERAQGRHGHPGGQPGQGRLASRCRRW